MLVPIRQHWRRLSGLLLLLLLAAAGPALAQRPAYRPGYVVLAAAPTDTLRGDVDLRRADRARPRVRFRTAQQAPREYRLEELAAAGDNSGQHFRRVPQPRGGTPRPALLRVLVAGPTSLYLDPTRRLLPAYYLAKPDQPTPTPLSRRQVSPVLRAAFADCPTVNTTVAYAGQYEYSPVALRRYVLNYNRCRYPAAPVLAPELYPVRDRAQWEAQVGLAQLYMMYPYTSPRLTKSSALVPTVGLLGNMVLINHLSLVTGLTFGGYRSDNTFNTPVIGTGYTQINHFRTTGTVVRWPLLVRVTARAPAALWRPYLQAGVQICFLTGSELEYRVNYTDPNTPLTPFTLRESMNGSGRGFQAEGGLRIRYGSGVLGTGFRLDATNGFPVRGRGYLNAYDQWSFVLTYAR